MSTADVIQSIGVLATIIFSFIALLQSIKSKKDAIAASESAKKANYLSEKANEEAHISNVKSEKANEEARISNEKAENANELAKKALDDARKGFMPIVRFTSQFNIVQKSVLSLRNQVTFDFDDLLLDINNTYADIDFEEDEVVCIEAEIENCGNGIITGIEIKDFFIQSGNKVSIDVRSQEEVDALCHFKECTCEEEFVLLPGEKNIVNFIVTKNVMERNNSDFYWAQAHIEEFVEEYDNIMISMSLEISSVNKSIYQQDYLWGTYLEQKLVHNSFSQAFCKEEC